MNEEMVLAILLIIVLLIGLPLIVFMGVVMHYFKWLDKPPKNKDEWKLK